MWMEFYLDGISIQTESLLLGCNTPTEVFHHHLHHMKKKNSTEKLHFHKGHAYMLDKN